MFIHFLKQIRFDNREHHIDILEDFIDMEDYIWAMMVMLATECENIQKIEDLFGILKLEESRHRLAFEDHHEVIFAYLVQNRMV